MKIKAYQSFEKRYRKLPVEVQEKVGKQIELLSDNFRHPSLHTKKIKGKEGVWEVRIDDFYRLSSLVSG